MFKSFNKPAKKKIVNYLFLPPFQPQTNKPVIISESGIGIEIIYYPVKVSSQAQNILIHQTGNDYNIPEITTNYNIPSTVIGRISFNYGTEPITFVPLSGAVINYDNSIPLIPATQQLIYQDFDRLLVYIDYTADNWAFLLRIIKERP